MTEDCRSMPRNISACERCDKLIPGIEINGAIFSDMFCEKCLLQFEKEVGLVRRR